MKFPNSCLFVFLVSNMALCHAKEKFRILGLFPDDIKSHFYVFKPLIEELARRGHEVTVVSHFPQNNQLPNYRDISLVEPSRVFSKVFELHMIDRTPLAKYRVLQELADWGVKSCEEGLYNPAVQELIKSDEKFDLILTELFNSNCFLGFVHRFKAPFVTMSSHQIMPWGNQYFNNPDNPSYIPTIFQGFSSKMNFVERVKNTFGLVVEKTSFDIMCNETTQAIVEKVFGPGVPALKEIAENVSTLLVNTHYTLHGSRPYLPNVVEVGGIHIPENKSLPQDIQEFLDGATEGALYFSWGSRVKTATIPEDKLKPILNVISSIPRRVLWKWENDDLPGKPENLMVKKWMPQVDILSHPNVKGYLAHGGLLGISEGVYTGVPMVVVPMYGDQFHNAAAAEERGMAVVLQYEDLNEDTLREALNKIFNDTSYYKNAQAVSKAYRDRPSSPLETAVWWTEFVARKNGLQYLRSAGADLSWYQYHLLDVIAFAFAVCLIIILAIVFVVKKLLSAVCGKKEKKSITNGVTKKKTNNFHSDVKKIN